MTKVSINLAEADRVAKKISLAMATKAVAAIKIMAIKTKVSIQKAIEMVNNQLAAVVVVVGAAIRNETATINGIKINSAAAVAKIKEETTAETMIRMQ